MKIAKSTAKAHLVEAADGRRAWVPKSWRDAAGTVKLSAFERNAADFALKEQAYAEVASHGEPWVEIGIAQKLSEKACMFLAYTSQNGEWDQLPLEVWIPRGCIKGFRVAPFMLRRKAEEVREIVPGAKVRFGTSKQDF